jgi:hypothetical protein
MSVLFIIEGQSDYPDWGDIAVDVHKSDNHILSSEVTDHTLEAGSIVSDHVISKPRQLSILFEQVNTKDGLSRAIRIWQEIKNVERARKLITAITEHDIYNHMIFENVNALQAAPMKGALQFSTTLKQINSVQLMVVKTPASQLAQDGTNKTASSEISRGVQNAPQVVDWQPILFPDRLTPIETPIPSMTQMLGLN